MIDFNRVYDEYIRPALELAGLEPFRADKEIRAGDIIADMFQELLVADLVVADLTIENPNVWYELGVRHALRARGVVIVCGGRVDERLRSLHEPQAALRAEGRRTGSRVLWKRTSASSPRW